MYNSNAYLAYLYKENETELMVNDPGRDAQCQSIRPSDTDPTTSTKNWKLKCGKNLFKPLEINC